MIDICLCNSKDCKRKCLRNVSEHNLKGRIYTLTCFEEAQDFVEHNTCPYFIEKED